MNTKNKITKRQKELLGYIIEAVREDSLPPTLAEMAKALGVKSKNSVAKLLKELEDKKFIVRDGSARGIKILNSLGRELQKGIKKIPLVGEVPAGGPVLTEEYVEDWVNLPDTLTKDRKDIFLLRVTGNSMINAGIFDKDLVLVQPTQDIYDQDIVVAIIENEATVKRFIKKSNKKYLKAENLKYKNIYPDGEWSIQGKVIGVIRQID